MSQIAIKTHDLRRDFGEIRAVDGINIEVPVGIVFGFLGPNGSGKTTTIRLLLGLLEPTSGGACVLGYDILLESEAIRRESGALLEDTGLYERLSAEDNLEFYGRVWHLPAIQRRERIRELLTSIDLWERRKEMVRDWSRGMRQKLAVARALLHHPRLVFLDEPTSGLDAIAAAALRQDLERLVRLEGMTVFLTTHNMAEAERLCDQVAVIRQGRLLAVGTPDELTRRQAQNRLVITGRGFSAEVLGILRSQPQVSGVHLDGNQCQVDLLEDMNAAPLVQVLVQAGVEIDEVNRSRTSLEEAFLNLVEENHD